MGLLSSAKNQINKAKKSMGNVKDRLSRVAQSEQELQDEENYYGDLEGQVEDDLRQGDRDVADEEAQKLEKGELEVGQRLQNLDEEMLEIFKQNMREVKLTANAMKEREGFEERTRKKVRQIANEHKEFDERLRQAAQNLERYIQESKQNSNRMTRGEVGREAQTDQGKNWQDLEEEAEHMRDSINDVVRRENNMLELLNAEEKSMEEFKSEWEQSLEEMKKLRNEVQTFYGQEKEMEKIAEELGDSDLMQRVAEGEEEAKQIKQTFKELDSRIEEIEQMLEKLETEDDSIVKHQSNVTNRAEEILEMSENARRQVAEVENIVERDNYEHLEFTSPDKWEKEIEVINRSLNSVEELVQKFEEIEEQEIQIEEREEQVVETEAREGAQAVGDD